MIKFKNTNANSNKYQEEFLKNCPPEDRRFHELLFTHGNITSRYHTDAKRLVPTLEDWKEWLTGLPEVVSKHMKEKGFEECKSVLSFTRYVMEKNDIGIDEYISLHMDKEDLAEFQAMMEEAKKK
jgi:hypothetical protein